MEFWGFVCLDFRSFITQLPLQNTIKNLNSISPFSIYFLSLSQPSLMTNWCFKKKTKYPIFSVKFVDNVILRYGFFNSWDSFPMMSIQRLFQKSPKFNYFLYKLFSLKMWNLLPNYDWLWMFSCIFMLN